MSDDKQPMQADGHDQAGEKGDKATAGRPDMGANAGQSGGGAYPNPHNDPDNADPQNTFIGHAGQSDMGGMGDGDSGPLEQDRNED